jgi:hypothetical protein
MVAFGRVKNRKKGEVFGSGVAEKFPGIFWPVNALKFLAGEVT